MNKLRKSLLLSAVSYVATSAAYAESPGAQPAVAGSPANSGSTEIGEVIVTAQKRSERLLDVPLSITAVSGAQLARQGINNTADLAKVVPGFQFQTSQYGTPVYQVRGIGFFDRQLAVSPTVTVYVDQTPLPYARMAPGASLDVERVEVLKGPQGTLFGENSTGGAINYIAAKPTKTFAEGLDATYARFNEFDLGGFVSGPLTDTLSVRVAGRYEGRDGWQESITHPGNDGTNGKRDFLVGRIIADWAPTDRLKVEVNVNGWRDRSDLQAGQAVARLPISPATPTTPLVIQAQNELETYPFLTHSSDTLADWDAGVSRQVHNDFYQAAGRIDYALSDAVHVVAISSYTNLAARTPLDLDATSVDVSEGVESGSLRSFSQELRLEGDLGNRLKWVVGGNYQQDNTTDFYDALTYNASNAEFLGIHFVGPNSRDDQRVRDLAAFASLEYQITDQLSIQGSIRYTDEVRNFAGGSLDNGLADGVRIPLNLIGDHIPPGGYVTELADGTTGIFLDRLHESNVPWRASLNWKALPNLLLYGNVTKGFKSGSYPLITGLVYTQLKPVVQESVIAYETGFKVSLADRKVDMTGAVYYYDYDNKQLQGDVNVPPFGFLPALINVPRSRVVGAEFDIAARPIRGLQLTAGGNFNDSEVTGPATTVSPFGNQIDIKGEAFPRTPKWQLTGDAEYDFDVGSGVAPFLGGHISYNSATSASFGSQSGPAGTQNLFWIDGYTLVDLRVGVRINDKYTAQVFGKNVTGTNYWNSVEHVSDTVVRMTGYPATYGVSLSARF